MRKQNKNNKGFTLIELLVVMAIIALLSSLALIAFTSARQKSRDAKRLADMTQMSTAMALYFATNKGYPSSSTGIPSVLVPTVASTLPTNPQPSDGSCGTSYPPPVPGGNDGTQYYYYPSGTAYLATDGITKVYPDFGYYFCIGAQTGNFSPGLHVLTPQGVQ